MKVTAINRPLFEIKADIYVVPVFTGAKKQFAEKTYNPLGAKINSMFASGMINGGYKKKTVITPEIKGSMKRIFFIGLGEADKLSAEKIRDAAGFCLKEIKAFGVKTAASSGWLADSKSFKAELEGFMLADYAYNELKTVKKEEQLDGLFFAAAGMGLKGIINEVKTVVDAVFMAKDLMNGPGNLTTPDRIARTAVKTAGKNKKMKIKIFGLAEVGKMGMGAFYAVAKGSDEPAKFIAAEYRGAPKNKKPIVFIGKGITFDSGGISLKPSASALSVIEDMKYDMSGAAAVIALMRIIPAMGLKINAVFLAPVTENLPSGKAYKPGDVLKTLSGRTVEVISTDAEGRLVLCDALTYAKRYNPALIVDIATLTGACVMALGHYATGLMGNNEEFLAVMKKAGRDTGEIAWELPLLEEYAESLKSKCADIKNLGSGGAGTPIAGLFLKEFVGDTPWLHLDIAGTAYGVKDKSYIPDGVAAAGIRLMYDFTKKIIKQGMI